MDSKLELLALIAIADLAGQHLGAVHHPHLAQLKADLSNNDRAELWHPALLT